MAILRFAVPLLAVCFAAHGARADEPVVLVPSKPALVFGTPVKPDAPPGLKAAQQALDYLALWTDALNYGQAKEEAERRAIELLRTTSSSHVVVPIYADRAKSEVMAADGMGAVTVSTSHYATGVAVGYDDRKALERDVFGSPEPQLKADDNRGTKDPNRHMRGLVVFKKTADGKLVSAPLTQSDAEDYSVRALKEQEEANAERVKKAQVTARLAEEQQKKAEAEKADAEIAAAAKKRAEETEEARKKAERERDEVKRERSALSQAMKDRDESCAKDKTSSTCADHDRRVGEQMEEAQKLRNRHDSTALPMNCDLVEGPCRATFCPVCSYRNELASRDAQNALITARRDDLLDRFRDVKGDLLGNLSGQHRPIDVDAIRKALDGAMSPSAGLPMPGR